MLVMMVTMVVVVVVMAVLVVVVVGWRVEVRPTPKASTCRSLHCAAIFCRLHRQKFVHHQLPTSRCSDYQPPLPDRLAKSNF